MFLLLAPEPLFFIFSVFFFLCRLCRVVIWRSQLWILEFRFFKVGKVLRTLGLYLWKSVVEQIIAFRTMSIQLLNHDARSSTCFSLHINCSLYYLLKTSWCLIFLLYLNLDGRFEVFLEKTDHSRLIGGSNSTKLY